MFQGKVVLATLCLATMLGLTACGGNTNTNNRPNNTPNTNNNTTQNGATTNEETVNGSTADEAGMPDQSQGNMNNGTGNGNMVEDAGNAVGNAVEDVGDAAGNVIEGAGDVVGDAVKDVTGNADHTTNNNTVNP